MRTIRCQLAKVRCFPREGEEKRSSWFLLESLCSRQGKRSDILNSTESYISSSRSLLRIGLERFFGNRSFWIRSISVSRTTNSIVRVEQITTRYYPWDWFIWRSSFSVWIYRSISTAVWRIWWYVLHTLFFVGGDKLFYTVYHLLVFYPAPIMLFIFWCPYLRLYFWSRLLSLHSLHSLPRLVFFHRFLFAHSLRRIESVSRCSCWSLRTFYQTIRFCVFFPSLWHAFVSQCGLRHLSLLFFLSQHYLHWYVLSFLLMFSSIL